MHQSIHNDPTKTDATWANLAAEHTETAYYPSCPWLTTNSGHAQWATEQSPTEALDSNKHRAMAFDHSHLKFSHPRCTFPTKTVPCQQIHVDRPSARGIHQSDCRHSWNGPRHGVTLQFPRRWYDMPPRPWSRKKQSVLLSLEESSFRCPVRALSLG